MNRTDMNRKARRRAKIRADKMNAKGQFHPRSLARSMAHSRLAYADFEKVNKVTPGTTQSLFAKRWREVAGQMAM